jgi:hypothetical protein
LTVHPDRSDDPGDDRREAMAIGPVQLIVLGFDEPEFKGEVLAGAKLKEQSILTEEEFQAKKKQILDL